MLALSPVEKEIISEKAKIFIAAAIKEAGGNEVFFVGSIAENSLIDDVTVVQGTADGLLGRVTLHEILHVEFFPRLLQVVLLPVETSLTVRATHLNSELAAAGVMQSVKSRNFSTGRTAWILLGSRWAKVVSDDLLFFFLRICSASFHK